MDSGVVKGAWIEGAGILGGSETIHQRVHRVRQCLLATVTRDQRPGVVGAETAIDAAAIERDPGRSRLPFAVFEVQGDRERTAVLPPEFELHHIALGGGRRIDLPHGAHTGLGIDVGDALGQTQDV